MKLLFVTRYVDRVLLFFLQEIAKYTSVRVVRELDNQCNGELAASGVDTIRLAPRSLSRATLTISPNSYSGITEIVIR